jgi:hypothetical protein
MPLDLVTAGLPTFSAFPMSEKGIAPPNFTLFEKEGTGVMYYHERGTYTLKLIYGQCGYHLQVIDCGPATCGNEPTAAGYFLDLRGSHDSFTRLLVPTASDWDFAYTFGCQHSPVASSGNILIAVKSPHQYSATFGAKAIASAGLEHLGTQRPLYLEIRGADLCTWHVIAGPVGKVPAFKNPAPPPKLAVPAPTARQVIDLDEADLGDYSSPTLELPTSWELSYAFDCSADNAPPFLCLAEAIGPKRPGARGVS